VSPRSRSILCLTLLSGLSWLWPSSASPAGSEELGPKQQALWSKLGERVADVDRRLDGVLGLCVKDLRSGATLRIRAEEPFPQASSIKLAVLYEVYRQADEGRIDLAELTEPRGQRAGGSGVLQHLGQHVRLSWRDHAVLMMAVSDNEATNLLIDRIGIPAVNHRLAELGLGTTRLRRRMMDLAAAREGRENVSTPDEMARLMEAFHAAQGLSVERADDMLAVAAVPKRSAFREPLPAGLRVADKPGGLEGVRCVSALVEVPERPYVASIMTAYLSQGSDGEAAIREISGLLYETFRRLARSSELGRVISER
jgi:beta-lactamase class A